MASTQAFTSKPSKRPKINIISPRQLFIELTQEDTKILSPKHQLPSPSAPNAPLKTPCTRATSSSSIASKLKSLTSSISLSTNAYLNLPISPPPRVPPSPLTQESEPIDITLTLSPITSLDIQFNTPSPPMPSPPLFEEEKRRISLIFYQVKGVRAMLDEAFLPKMDSPTRNISVTDVSCPLCEYNLEDVSHLFFGCSMAKDIQNLVCRWWNLDVYPYDSYEGWLSWFKSIRLGSKLKDVLEDVFYVSWWSIWYFRNQLLFTDPVPRKDVIFDNIILGSFNWCIARNCSSLNWVSWLQHPYLIPL
nr:RNA-directed DNA polymerase, eukaryota [Tanacetum cinerariifolium]